jgi:RHS repeat-associated protein
MTSFKDANLQPTTFTYNDPNHFWRVTEVSYADGGADAISYADTPGAFTVTDSRQLGGPSVHQTTQVLDGLGRVTEFQDTSASTYVDTTYDSLGRVYTVSNPYASKSDPTYGLTTYGYDALNRFTSLQAPDGSTTSTTYSTKCGSTTDPATRMRTLCSDALGRVTSVTEDPNGLNYQTTYTYDDLNDLTGVAQGSQTRTYNYDMLARLTRAQTPEVNVGGTQCSTTYGYDANGNLTSKVAPLANQSTSCTSTVTTTYAYDALNRLTSKSYSDGTPTATFSYDQSSVTIGSWSSGSLGYPKGRMTEATTTASGSVNTAVVYSYDPMGRTQDLWQCTPFNCGSSSIWEAQYNYDLGGDITSWVHPWPITFTNTVNSAQQVTAIQSSWVDSNHPQYVAQSISYTPWGAPGTLVNGCAGSGCTNVQETYGYNKQLQPALIELGTTSNPTADDCLVYNYYGSSPTSCALPSPGTSNNGNVMGYYDQDSATPSLSHTATYTYDGVNRLATAVATGNATYNLTFGYDAYGNMTCVTNGQTNGPCPNWTFNSSTNQLNTSQGFVYDAAGDLTTDVSGPTTRNYAWDAEGRLTQVTDNGGNTSRSYVYNALGQRVEIKTSGGQLEQVFDPQGERIGYYSVASGNNQWLLAYVLWRGRGLARYYLTTEFDVFHANALGSATMATNPTTGAVIEDILFYPWGQEFNAPTLYDAHFAGLPASNLPGFPDLSMRETPYRFYAPNPGRWHSPDPVGAVLTNPQSLNRYAYVTNNPTSLIDPAGLLLRNPGWQDDYGCTVDGIAVDCAEAYQEAAGGAIVGCGNNQCQAVGLDPQTGQQAILRFIAGAGGATGYLSGYDISQGLNEMNGTFMSDAVFQAYLQGGFLDAINAQLAAVISALEARNTDPGQITAFINYVSEHFSEIDIEGGNVNFFSLGTDSVGQSFNFTAFGCSNERCDEGALGTLDFSHNNGMFHLDTADPYSGVWGALAHFGVDLILGNTAYWVLPR